MHNKNETEHFFSEQESLKELRSIAWGEVTAVPRDGHIAATRIVQIKQKGNGRSEDNNQPVMVARRRTSGRWLKNENLPFLFFS